MAPRPEPFQTLTVQDAVAPLGMGIGLEIPSPTSVLTSGLPQAIVLVDPMSSFNKRYLPLDSTALLLSGVTDLSQRRVKSTLRHRAKLVTTFWQSLPMKRDNWKTHC